MPVCEISFAKGFFLESEQENIVNKLTKLLLDSEGLIDNPISRSICLIDLRESNKMYIGGKLADYGKVVVKIFAFANAYDDDMKEKLCNGITKVFIEHNNKTKELNGNNIWCLIFPLQPFDFCVAGKPVTLEMTRKIVSEYRAKP